MNGLAVSSALAQLPLDLKSKCSPFLSRFDFAKRYVHVMQSGPIEPHNYQVASLESRAHRKILCCGRDVGKTTDLILQICWLAICTRNKTALMCAMHESTLTPFMRNLIAVIQRSPEIAAAVVDIRQAPFWHITFKTGFQLEARIAGPGGVNFLGQHVDYQFIDEAQEMSNESWSQLLPGLLAGGSRFIYGVPNGVRNYFYDCSHDPRYERFFWPSTINPLWTKERDQELADFYGGRHSPGYLHQVLAEHGFPEFTVFDIDSFNNCVRECVDSTCTSMARFRDQIDDYKPSSKKDIVLGWDVGFRPDPTVLSAFHVNGDDEMSEISTVAVTNMKYNEQCRFVADIAEDFKVCAIGLDIGGVGIPIFHALSAHLAGTSTEIVPVSFGSLIGITMPGSRWLIRERSKVALTGLLTRAIESRSIVFLKNSERTQQYASHTYQVSAAGNIHYVKGNDHIIDADRCAIAAVYRQWLSQVADEMPQPVRHSNQIESF